MLPLLIPAFALFSDHGAPGPQRRRQVDDHLHADGALPADGRGRAHLGTQHPDAHGRRTEDHRRVPAAQRALQQAHGEGVNSELCVGFRSVFAESTASFSTAETVFDSNVDCHCFLHSRFTSFIAETVLGTCVMFTCHCSCVSSTCLIEPSLPFWEDMQGWLYY